MKLTTASAADYIPSKKVLSFLRFCKKESFAYFHNKAVMDSAH
jgi:hypothetical protein